MNFLQDLYQIIGCLPIHFIFNVINNCNIVSRLLKSRKTSLLDLIYKRLNVYDYGVVQESLSPFSRNYHIILLQNPSIHSLSTVLVKITNIMIVI